QRNEDEAVATLGDEVEAVVEKLPEEGEPGIERRRQPEIRPGVLEEKDLGVVARSEGLLQPRAGDDLNAFFQHVVCSVENAVRSRIVGGRVSRRIVDG